MYKMGVIGDRDTAIAFKALGINIFPVNSELDAENTIKKLAKDNYAVIFITEQLAKNIMGTIEEYNSNLLPSIILIPGNKGTLGIAIKNLEKSVEKAIGVDILFESEGDSIERG